MENLRLAAILALGLTGCTASKPSLTAVDTPIVPIVTPSTPELTPIPIPRGVESVKGFKNEQQEAIARQMVWELGQILQANIQEEIYPPSDKAYYDSLALLPDSELFRFMSEHYVGAEDLRFRGLGWQMWRNIEIGPTTKKLNLSIEPKYKGYSLGVNLLDVRELFQSSLELIRVPPTLSTIEARQLARRFFKLPPDLLWQERLSDGVAPATFGEYTSPKERKTEIWILHGTGGYERLAGSTSLIVSEPLPPGR